MKNSLKDQIKNINADFNTTSAVLALAGPMASGKNYVCSIFEQFGWHSIDADLLVHEAIKKAAPQIIETFQPFESQFNVKITNTDGSINRRALGVILFARPDLLAKQEAIVYPIITSMIQAFIATHDKSIIMATVLYKTPDLLQLCQAIIYVRAPLLTRLKRARRRDLLPLKQIIKRFLSQRHLLKKYQNTNLPIILINNK